MDISIAIMIPFMVIVILIILAIIQGLQLPR